ncbi:MAG: DUF11 domain-containing protein, partial [Acidimicrobiia bacterium]|nr:DUF11 domain-containing protein [Acidimicrobiia bacterium]
SVVDTLPAGLAFVSGSGDGWSCSAVAQVVTCTSSESIAAGGSAGVITLVVTPSVAGSVVNTAVVSGGGQSNTGNDSDSDPTTVDDVAPPETADLTIAKSHSGDFTVGQQGSYALAVSNVGAAASSGEVSVVDTLPAGLAFVSGSGDGWSCSAVAQVVTCTSSESIAAGGSAGVITLVVTPSVAGSVVNTAVVSGGGQSNELNDGAADPTVVDDGTEPGDVDLALTKSHEGNFKVGRRGTYSLEVTNVGTTDSGGELTVTDTLPRGMIFKGFEGEGWTCAAERRVVTCTSSEPVAAGGSAAPLSITVKPFKAGHLTNTAAVAGGGQAAGDNDTAADPTVVRRARPWCGWGGFYHWRCCGTPHWFWNQWFWHDGGWHHTNQRPDL